MNGEGGDNYAPKATEHATREKPILEDFLYLFFSPSETSQAAGRAFWERRHTRADQDVSSSMAAMAAQGNAIAAWGVVPQKDRYLPIQRIKQPVLVINGANDIMVPTINSFILQQNIPNASLIIYPDSGHGAIFHTRIYLSPTRASFSMANDVIRAAAGGLIRSMASCRTTASGGSGTSLRAGTTYSAPILEHPQATCRQNQRGTVLTPGVAADPFLPRRFAEPC